MPRRERDRELARRRKGREERRKLRAKGLLPPPAETVKTEAVKEVGKKKAEKAPPKEAPPKEAPKETPKLEVPKEGEGPSTQEGQS
jgi:hypothetical protein